MDILIYRKGNQRQTNVFDAKKTSYQQTRAKTFEIGSNIKNTKGG